MNPIATFFIGLFIGGIIGVVVMCSLSVNRNSLMDGEMMKKETVEYFCDACKKPFREEELTKAKMPIETNCEWTEGHSEKPHSLMNSTNLRCGYRLNNLRIDRDRRSMKE